MEVLLFLALLESRLHNSFLRAQVNKVNPRKEFFRIPITTIRKHIEGLGIQAHWTMSAGAEEYRESLVIEEQLLANPGAATDWVEQQIAAVEQQRSILIEVEE